MAEPTSFMKMLERLARTTKFNTFNDVLRNGMLAECKRKYKAYPGFTRRLALRWKKQVRTNQISSFIKNNMDLFFEYWFCYMFQFDPKRLKILEPNTRSDVDFNAKFHYLYSKDEIAFLEDLIKKHELKYVKPLQVFNQLILIGLRMLGPIIEVYFKRPYDFQPEEMKDEDLTEGKLVKIFFSSREA